MTSALSNTYGSSSGSLVDQYMKLLKNYGIDIKNPTGMRNGSYFGGGMSNPNFGGNVQPAQIPAATKYKMPDIPNPDEYINSLQPTIDLNRDKQTNAALARLGKSGMGGMGTPVYNSVANNFAAAGNEMNTALLKAKLDSWNKMADFSQAGELDQLSRELSTNQFNANSINSANENNANRGLSAWQTAGGWQNDQLGALTSLLSADEGNKTSRMNILTDLAKSAAPWGMLDVDPDTAALRAKDLYSKFSKWL